MFVMAACVAMTSLSSVIRNLVLDVYLEYPEQETERLREDLKDTLKLRICLERFLAGDTDYERPKKFMRKFCVDAKAMQTVLMDIISETSMKTKWKVPLQRNPEDIFIASHYLCEAIKWLGVCADMEGKQFLMSIAEDSTKDKEFRHRALDSYVHCADAQEVRDAITRFLSDDMKATFRPNVLDIYYLAMRAYDKAEDDMQIRDAIVTALSVALVAEECDLAFGITDKLLAERNKGYAESPQRKAALERMDKPSEKKTP